MPISPERQALRDAVAEFDRTQPERERAWNQVACSNDIHFALRADDKALSAVQDAFYNLTRHINSRSNCELVGIDFMRRIAALED